MRHDVALLLDSLTCGGAQRQALLLCRWLRRQGIDVVIVTYTDADFFADVADRWGIPVIGVQAGSRVMRLLRLAAVIHKARPRVLVAFLNRPSVVAELIGLLDRRCKVVVSERNAIPLPWSLAEKARIGMHHFADTIVCNSRVQEHRVAKQYPQLRGRTRAIRNCVDLEEFRPMEHVSLKRQCGIRLVGVGRVHPSKNIDKLIDAAWELKRSFLLKEFHIEWHGPSDWRFAGLRGELGNRIRDRGLASHVEILEATGDAASLVPTADGLILVSEYEGCPNVVCEALACGVPVLATPVGEIPHIIEDGVDGILLESAEPRTIARGIHRLISMKTSEHLAMRRRARVKAETLFAEDIIGQQWMDVLSS